MIRSFVRELHGLSKIQQAASNSIETLKAMSVR